MRNYQTRKLRIWKSDEDTELCRGCATLADMDGRKCLLFLSKRASADLNHLWLHAQFLNLTTQTAPEHGWDKLNLSALLSMNPTRLSCVGLGLLNGGDSIVIALRSGELISVQTNSAVAEIIGEFIDDCAEKSGILCISASPDGDVLVVVSPVKVTVMSSNWDLIAEEPFELLGDSASISWRGDGEFFVVSVRDVSGKVQGYVYDRDAQDKRQLDSPDLKAEDEFHGRFLAWQPRVGGKICHNGPEGRLLFFERNGLRHLRSDFDPFGNICGREANSRCQIIDLAWSLDSDKLAIVSAERGVFAVSIFIHSNYKWYNKKRYTLREEPSIILWDEDDCNCLLIQTVANSVVYIQLQPVSAKQELSSRTHTAVTDCTHLLLTDLCQAVIPPPMCHGSLEAAAAISDVCPIPGQLGLGILSCDGNFQKLSLVTNLSTAPADCTASPIPVSASSRNVWNLNFSPTSSCLISGDGMSTLLEENILLTVRCGKPQAHRVKWQDIHDQICIFKLEEGARDALLLTSVNVSGCIVAVTPEKIGRDEFLIATDNGVLIRWRLHLDGKDASLTIIEKITLKPVDDVIRIVSLLLKVSSSTFCLVQSKSGMLVLVNLETEKLFVISRDCTSFELYRNYLTFTTRNHVLYCMPIEEEKDSDGNEDETHAKSLLAMLKESPSIVQQSSPGHLPNVLPDSYGATRPIDRGSQIVAGLADDVRLVLQAPRGNIETIAPRPIVISRVRELSLYGEYGKAFRLSRQQRIDMNELVDVNVDAFLSNIDTFVAQVGKPSHMTIFLTYLKGTEQKTNSICEALIKALKNAGRQEHVSVLLTAYIRKQPPEYENALLEVWHEHKKDSERAESLLEYLFVLCKDDGALYYHALGTYNLFLAMLVAKTSKELDPAEYNVELRSLHGMNEHEQHFEIDVKLGRYEKALRHLYNLEKNGTAAIDVDASISLSNEIFERSIGFAIEKKLFQVALELFQSTPEVLGRIRSAYGVHLIQEEQFNLAGSVFLANGELFNAARAYDHDGNWKLCIGALSRCDMDDSDRLEFLDGVADRLQQRGMPSESAYLRANYLRDVDSAVEILIGAEQWPEAIEVVSGAPSEERWKLVEESVIAAGESLTDDLKESATKVRDRGKRLLAVRETKRLQRERVVNTEEGSDVFSTTSASSFVSNVSDLSFVGRSAATSVYTSASGTVSGAQRRKDKQAQRRLLKSKKKRVKEGHPHEEEYILQYLRNLLPGEFLNNRVAKLMNALLFFQNVELVRQLARSMDTLADESKQLAGDVIENCHVNEILRNRSWQMETHI